MASIVEVRRRIASITSIMKVTKVMHMISVAKLNKSKSAIAYHELCAKNASNMLYNVIHNYSNRNQIEEQCLSTKKIKLIVLFSSDRGLCGSINSSIFKAARNIINEAIMKNQDIILYPIGKKAQVFVSKNAAKLKNIKIEINEQSYAEALDYNNINNMVHTICNLYKEYQCDIAVLYSYFKNILLSETIMKSILPLTKESIMHKKHEYYNLTTELNVLNGAIELYISKVLFDCYFHNLTSINSNRMKAMDSATKNSDELRSQLKLSYNKIRQSIITNELSDIVSGSEATS